MKHALTLNDQLTMVIVSGQVLFTYIQVVVFVQLPELAVYHIEVLVGEKICDLVDVIFLFKYSQGLAQRNVILASPEWPNICNQTLMETRCM